MPDPRVLPANDGPVEGLYLGRHPSLFDPSAPPVLRPPALWKRLVFAAGGLLVALVAVYAYAALTAPYATVDLVVGLPENANDLPGFTRQVVLVAGSGIGWCVAPRRFG